MEALFERIQDYKTFRLINVYRGLRQVDRSTRSTSLREKAPEMNFSEGVEDDETFR